MKKGLLLLSLIGVLAILFFAGESASQGKTEAVVPSQNEASALQALTLTDTHFDFGTISMQDGKVMHSFTVTNKSESPISIRKITTSCMCTEALFVQGDARKGPFGMPGHGSVPLVNETVPAQESFTVEVVFDPSAHGPAGVGKIERAVFVEDAKGDVQTITIKALVTP